jgi:signal transduction histidine kinase
MTGLRGTRRWIEVSATPLRDSLQEIIGCLSVSRDMTEDKHLRDNNRQQELQLMEASKMSALGTLVAGVAHEINNPNQTIQINSGLLQQVWEDTRKILDEYVSMHGPIKLGGLQYSGGAGAHADLINDINIGAEQIKTVVGRLRTFSRPYDGIHDNINGAKIQLNDAVGPALALLRHAIRKGTDNFHSNLQDKLPAIQANRQQIQQIVINLVLNALEFLPDRSHGIWVDTWLNTEQSCVELRVRDEGIGIKPEELDQVMDPFYTTRREQGGTGLGLSITHSLLQELGGTIHFESKPGKGTLVVVCLPVVEH